MTQAAETLARSVPNGTHFKYPAFPSPLPLSRAKNHLIQTPTGPTMHASHNWGLLPPSSNSSFNKVPLKAHNKPSSKSITIIDAMCRLKVSTRQQFLVLEFSPESLWVHVISHLNAFAVSTPKTMEQAERNKPAQNHMEESSQLLYKVHQPRLRIPCKTGTWK